METTKKIVGYKATDKGLKCRGFQYEVGESYEHDGIISLCNSGFHFCQNPLDVLDYYNLCDSEFLSVESHGEYKTDEKKTVTNKLKVTASIGLPGLIEASIEWIFGQTKKSKKNDYSQLAASGDYSNLAASGKYSNLAASGDFSKLAASGKYNNLAASGNYSQLAASGDDSELAASGDDSKLAASGKYSKLAASGVFSIAAGIGVRNIAKAKKGSWIVLAEWQYDTKIDKWLPVCVLSAQVDGENIKEDTYYKVIDRKFVEVDQ
jgi:hypothetical protein